MRLYISTDFEGVAGIVDWDQILAGRDDYEMGRGLLLGEVNAAIRGALRAGATQIVVNDSHSFMRNLNPDLLEGSASLLSGRHKPLYMMEGLDDSFDAIFFLGYHGSIGASQAILGHTYNPRAIWEVRLNGHIVGESALNALVAAHYRVPIALITGDQATVAEARRMHPAPHCVQVKRSVTRTAAESLHPAVARARIEEAAYDALTHERPGGSPQFPAQTQVEVTFLTADMAEMSAWVRGVEPVHGHARTVRFGGESLLDTFRTFVTLVALTRSLVEQ
ncbi:MAG TPA: M55 family metallopeptidase [Ktedonobacterales bacterium]